MIEFINASASSKILERSKYLHSKFEYYETLKRQYNGIFNSTSTLNFTDIELKYLKWYLIRIETFLLKYAPKLLTFDFKIGKLKAGFDWNFPFTVEDCIFLTESKINEFINAVQSGNELYIKNSMSTMVHELVHVHQRHNPKLYEDMYTRIFGFRKAKVTIHDNVSQYKLTNPDGLDLNWIIPYDLKGSGYVTWFLPMAGVNQKCQFVDMLIEVKEKLYTSSYETVTPPVFLPVTAFPLYLDKFGISKQLYHPNEISARLIAEYVIQANIYPLSYQVIKYLN